MIGDEPKNREVCGDIYHGSQFKRITYSTLPEVKGLPRVRVDYIKEKEIGVLKTDF